MHCTKRRKEIGLFDHLVGAAGYTLMMFQRLAIANGHGWNRFLHTVDQVLPRRGDTLPLPFTEATAASDDEAAN